MNATQTQRPVEASQPSPRPETRTQSRRGRPWGPLSDSGEIATPYVRGMFPYMHSVRRVVG